MWLFFRGTVISFTMMVLWGCVMTSTPRVPMNCQVLCQDQLHACQQVCQDSCGKCFSYARKKAVDGYARYAHEQCIRGGIIIRDLKSYRDQLQCRKTSCDCRNDYQLCIRSCAGVMNKE